MLVFGDDKQNYNTAIFGLETLEGAPGAETGPLLGKTTPLNS